MRALLATLLKELLLLRRDRAGLLVLFVMPAVLVCVISLVQNNVLKAAGETGLKLLFLDLDGGDLGRRIGEELSAGGLVLVRGAEEAESTESARQAVASGRFQFAVVVPPGATGALRERARVAAERALDSQAVESTGAAAELAVFYDPIVQGSARTAILSSLRLVALGLETEEKLKMLAEALPARVDREVKARFPFTPPGLPTASPSLRAGWEGETLLSVHGTAAMPGDLPRLPTAVQQNVPAWSLFGMFFIVVPLAGTLIRERQEGTLQRLRSIPVSPLALLAGKIAAFVLVCQVQFALMLAVGKWVLPLLGTPVLEVGETRGAIFLLSVCAALAATGFGLLVGALASSYELASMFGAVSVVIAAALGGVMVPVYVMPEAMQTVSRFSPLAWGLNGFLDLFVRGGELRDILPNALSLLAFFAAMLAGAWTVFNRRSRRA